MLGAINWAGLFVFSALVLVICVFGLSLSGHFPAEHRKPELQGPFGRLIIVGSILAVAMSAAHALGLALGKLHPAVAVIGGGAAVLAAPLVLAKLPNKFVDGRLGLLSLAGSAALLAYLSQRLPG